MARIMIQTEDGNRTLLDSKISMAQLDNLLVAEEVLGQVTGAIREAEEREHPRRLTLV